MSTGRTIAGYLKTALEGIDDWTGKVYVYVPYTRTKEELRDNLVNVDDRIDVWFINRVGIGTLRRGEAPEVATRSRRKVHRFEIKGFVAVADDAQTLASEEMFQDLCDTIEEEMAPLLGWAAISSTHLVRRLDVSIGMDFFVGILCHVFTGITEVHEWLATTYTQS